MTIQTVCGGPQLHGLVPGNPTPGNPASWASTKLVLLPPSRMTPWETAAPASSPMSRFRFLAALAAAVLAASLALGHSHPIGASGSPPTTAEQDLVEGILGWLTTHNSDPQMKTITELEHSVTPFVRICVHDHSQFQCDGKLLPNWKSPGNWMPNRLSPGVDDVKPDVSWQ